ncbi:MAG: hypothetical protein II508_07380 [Acholeplasmatales bacterium]|nr:hypothetical protein [Acholeplasmatales bacterium]
MDNKEVEKKKNVSIIDFLYITSMVMFFIAILALRSPILYKDFNQNNQFNDVWFIAITLYAFGSLLCYFIGIFKRKKYASMEDGIYAINHYYGLFNFLLILPLDFGLLFMIGTNTLFPANYISVILYGVISLFFLVSLILRSTLRKRIETIGLRSFDMNSFIYFSYATLMLLLNVLDVDMTTHWVIILVGLNFIITHFTVYYPVKAMVFALDKRKYNPVTTVYKFVMRLVRKKIFFFIGLIFTILIGFFYWIGGLYAIKDSLFNIFFIIALFYFSLAIVRFITFLWNKKISGLEDSIRFKGQCKITIFNSISILILTILLGGLLFYIFNDSLSKERQNWFIFIQTIFLALRMIFLFMDVKKANQSKNPYNIAKAEGGVISTSVMLFSIVLSLNLYFGFNYIHKIVSLVLVFIILSSGIAVSAHTFILGILGLKGKIKEREDIENGD